MIIGADSKIVSLFSKSFLDLIHQICQNLSLSVPYILLIDMFRVALPCFLTMTLKKHIIVI